MKTILIIVAHPVETSFSFAMANRYKELALQKGYPVEVIDLYRDQHRQGFLTFDKDYRKNPSPEMRYYQEKIAGADELVFVFPYWWGGFPAILKNFIDWNFSKGFAYETKGHHTQGLLKGKTVKIFTTTYAPSWYYRLTGARKRFKNTVKKQIVEFCGMKLAGFKMFGSISPKNKHTADILKKITI